ncbi:phosphotransferase family protein [Micromonospora sp. NPDC005161]
MNHSDVGTGARPQDARATEATRPRHLNGLPVLTSRLAETLGDERWRDARPVLVPGGKSNLTYVLTSPAGEAILRRPPAGPLPRGAHDMRREVRVQRALHDTVVPVPKILMADLQGDLLGTPSYVMEKLPGHVVRADLPAGYADSPDDRAAIAHALVSTLAALHSLDRDEIGLQDFGRPDGYVVRQIETWASEWERLHEGDGGATDELVRRLDAAVPSNEAAATVLHGDYKLDNCLLDEQDPSLVRGVLDWEMSTSGEPLADLGMFLLYWREPGERQSTLAPAVSATGGFPRRADLVEAYARLTGRDVSRVGFFLALAHLKFAVIAQGVVVRGREGRMDGQTFDDAAEEAELFAQAGLDVLEGRL